MLSYTSNFNIMNHHCTFNGRIKVILVLLASGITILAIGFFRTDKKEVTLDTLNMQENIRRLGAYDNACATVIVGDSRVQAGVVPSEMSEFFKDGQIANFAYASASLGDKIYLNKIDDLFLANSKTKRIIVGVSPFSLTSSALNWNTFKVACQQKNSVDNEWVSVGPWRPIDLPSFISYKKLRQKKTFSAELHKEGWLAMNTQTSLKTSLEGYERKFEQSKVEQSIIDDFLKKVKQWHEEGIKVYGVRIPVHPEMLKLENRLSGWNFDKFTSDFEAAGGCWINSEMNYQSADGSHLMAREAIRFSHDLAEKIKKNEETNVGPTASIAKRVKQ